MAAEPELRYWDSCVFISLFAGAPPERVPACRAVLRAAEEGTLRLVTSTLTLVEAHRPHGAQRPVASDHRKTIASFFLHEYIVLVDLSRTIAEMARDFCWDSTLKPADAIHVATAVYAGANVLETYDPQLLNLRVILPNVSLAVRAPAPDNPLLFDQSSV